MTAKFKKNLIFPLLMLLLIQLNTSGLELSLPDRMNEITEEAYHDNFLRALKKVKFVQKDFPDNPAGYFFEIAILDKLQVDYMNKYREKDFSKLFKKAIKIARQFIRENPYDSSGYFFLGALQGYHGLHYYRVKPKISVFINALKAVNNLKKANKMNPDLMDVYFGLGTYFYWKAVKAPFLNFGSTRKQNKRKGIHYLQMAIEKGLYSRSEARGHLIRILIHEKRYREALNYLKQSIAKYPGALYQYRFRANIYMTQKNWQGLYEDSLTIKTLIENRPFSSLDTLIQTYYFKGLSEFHLGKIKKSKESFNLMVNLYKTKRNNIDLCKNLVQKAKKRLRKIKKQEKKLAKQLRKS